MRKFLISLFCSICILINLNFAFSIHVYAMDDISILSEIHRIEQSVSVISYQDWIDSILCNTAGDGNSDLYLSSLYLIDKNLNFTEYSKCLEQKIKSDTNSPPVSRQRQCLTYLLVSQSPDIAICKSVFDETYGKQGIMSDVYSLHLLNMGVPSDDLSASIVYQKILNQQCSDGGWSLRGDFGDVDVTSMVLQSFAVLDLSDEALEDSISDAIAFLSKSQLDNGGFMSFGAENAESAAQCWIALSMLGVDALSNEKFCKNELTIWDAIRNFQLADGSYSHLQGGESNQTATAQVYVALARYFDFLSLQREQSTTDDQSQLAIDDETLSDMKQEVTDVSTLSLPYQYMYIFVVFVHVVLATVLLLKKKRRIKTWAIWGGTFLLSMMTAYYFQGIFISKNNSDKVYTGTVSLSVRCDDAYDAAKDSSVIDSPVIVEDTIVSIDADDTVLDALMNVVQKNRLQIDVDGTSIGRIDDAYVRAIDNIYEFDYGAFSGWKYYVNGESPSESAGAYRVHDGDQILWLYSCGADDALP